MRKRRRLQDVDVERAQAQYDERRDEQVSERHQLGDIGVVLAAASRAGPLIDGDGDVAAVEREHWEQVGEADEDVDGDEDVQKLGKVLMEPLHGDVDRAWQ